LPDWLSGTLLAVIGIAILGSLAGVWWWTTSHHVELDAKNCPVKGPTAVTAVLIDRSDPITPLQQQEIRQRLLALVQKANPGVRFDLYVAEGDGVNTLTPKVSVCSPGRGDTANSLYQNPAMIQKAFDERFLRVVQGELENLMKPSSSANSPILESIKTVSIMSFGGLEKGSLPLSLMVVSDMVQNSAANSHFRGETSFKELERRPQWRGLQANLTGVDVTVLYLLRSGQVTPSGRPIQNRGHQFFWEQAIQASGGRVVSMESL
jgi:hypothetical protein